MYFIAWFVLFLAITKFCVTFYFDVILAHRRGAHIVSGAALFPPDSPIVVFCTIFCISLSLHSRTITFVSGPFQSRLKTLCPLCLFYSECICLDQGHSVIQPQCNDQNQESSVKITLVYRIYSIFPQASSIESEKNFLIQDPTQDHTLNLFVTSLVYFNLN